MTVEQYNGAPANQWGDFGNVGLEDIGAGDISMPRIQILHDEGKFKDSATGETFGPKARFVLLGLVKQRIMWDTEVDNGDHPQCKSPDFKVGFPQLRTDIPARKQFPWAKSNFDPKDYAPGDDGLIRLPCDVCVFKEWGKDKEKPPCSEQLTYACYYENASGDLMPGLISFQRASIKAARTYAGTFAAAKRPLFTAWTIIELHLNSRGKVTYSTPTFSKDENTDPSQWNGWGETTTQMREWLQAAPTVRDDGDADKKPRNTPASAKAATTIDHDDPWASAQPAAGPTTTAPVEDDDLPF
jgi:hypothetical protein